jgi:multisubunit Na+/H+ antiporter MnhE subunit
MSASWHVWELFSGFVSGIFILLVGYRILPVLDGAGYKKLGKLLRILGYACILLTFFLAVLQHVG